MVLFCRCLPNEADDSVTIRHTLISLIVHFGYYCSASLSHTSNITHPKRLKNNNNNWISLRFENLADYLTVFMRNNEANLQVLCVFLAFEHTLFKYL